jgi:hypothetical protein
MLKIKLSMKRNKDIMVATQHFIFSNSNIETLIKDVGNYQEIIYLMKQNKIRT